MLSTQGLRAGFLLPWLLSMTVASPEPQLDTPYGPYFYSTTSTPAVIPGSRLQEHYLWKIVDFIYPDSASRQKDVENGTFKPENCLPLGLEVWEDRIFVTFPKWRDGIPATLAFIPRDPATIGGNRSPAFQPYPSWAWHTGPNCYGITSVFRIATDSCGRLWVLDSGVTNAASVTKQTCPPQLLLFDLRSDELILRYKLPDDQVKQDSLFTNIVVDIREGKCDDAYVYISDVWRNGLLVYSIRQDRSWRIVHHLFYPDPLASQYNLHGLTWRWTDGIFGMALSPVDHESGDRTLLFHPMSSFREFAVPVSYVKNITLADENPEVFRPLGEARATTNGQSSAEAMDRRGVLFFNLVTLDSVGCWNSQQPYGYKPELLGIVAHSNESLSFPNDLKIDHELHQSIWVLSNRLHTYIYSKLDPNDYNFRILTARTDVAVQGTICDPNYVILSTPRQIGPQTGCNF